MNRYTEEQLEEVMKYKAQKSSTMAEDQQRNLMSIISMSDDLMKTIKNEEKYLWTDYKRKISKNNKNLLNPKFDRHCYTQRRNSPQQNITHDGLSEFDDTQSFTNQDNNFIKGIEKFKFLQLNDLEKSEYIPMKKKLNPQQRSPTKKQLQNKKVINNNKTQKNNTKTNNINIEVEKKIPIKKQKSKILTHTKSSMTLTTPIKHVKKHILQAVELKKQAQEKVFCKTPKHANIKQFYAQNSDHIPLYEKSKILSAKKLISMQQSRMMQQQAEIQEVTFWPMINSKSERIIEGTTFYSRLQDTMNRKQTNQTRIVYETMKPCTFVPKLNSNKLVESKVRKVWNDDNNREEVEFEQEVIRQQDEFEIENYPYDDRDWNTIKLRKGCGQKLFIN